MDFKPVDNRPELDFSVMSHAQGHKMIKVDPDVIKAQPTMDFKPVDIKPKLDCSVMAQAWDDKMIKLDPDVIKAQPTMDFNPVDIKPKLEFSVMAHAQDHTIIKSDLEVKLEADSLKLSDSSGLGICTTKIKIEYGEFVVVPKREIIKEEFCGLNVFEEKQEDFENNCSDNGFNNEAEPRNYFVSKTLFFCGKIVKST